MMNSKRSLVSCVLAAVAGICFIQGLGLVVTPDEGSNVTCTK